MLLNKMGINQSTVLTCVAFVYFISSSVADIKVSEPNNKVSGLDASCAKDDCEVDPPKSQSSTTAGKHFEGLCATAFSIHF